MNVTNEGNRIGTQIPESLSTKLNRLSEVAKTEPTKQFQNITHLISKEMLTWSFQQLRKNASAGIDGVTARDYEKNLQANIANLYERMLADKYRAQPLRRVYIEKEDGKKRPLSIPTVNSYCTSYSVRLGFFNFGTMICNFFRSGSSFKKFCFFIDC